MDLNISIKDASLLMGKGEYYVRNAIERGMMPGTYILSKCNIRTFCIPKNAFLNFIGMSEAEADEILALKKMRHPWKESHLKVDN